MPVNFSLGAASIGLGDLHHVLRSWSHRSGPRRSRSRPSIRSGAVLLRRGRKVGDVVRVIDADDDPRSPASAAGPGGRSWPGRATWLETSTSLMPPRANTSASDTFWQQTPTAPPSFSCNFCTSTDLCILPWDAVAHAMRLGIVAHLLDVALQRVQIEDQAGRLDVLPRPCRAGPARHSRLRAC